MSIEDVIDVETRVTEGVRRDAFERGVELGACCLVSLLRFDYFF